MFMLDNQFNRTRAMSSYLLLQQSHRMRYSFWFDDVDVFVDEIVVLGMRNRCLGFLWEDDKEGERWIH
jgi:hypothetical protein